MTGDTFLFETNDDSRTCPFKFVTKTQLNNMTASPLPQQVTDNFFNLAAMREKTKQGKQNKLEEKRQNIKKIIEHRAEKGYDYVEIDTYQCSSEIVKELKAEGFKVKEKYSEWDGHYYLIEWRQS